MWAVTLLASPAAYSGLQGPSVGRPLTLLVVATAFIMAVVATLLQADETVADRPEPI